MAFAAVMVLWLVGVSVPIVLWHAWHAVPLPSKVQAEVVEPRATKNTTWRVYHVLMHGCACSDQIGRWLRQRQPNAAATIMLLDAPDEAAEQWRAVGWAVETLAEQVLWDQWQIAGGPWLIVLADEQVVYRGGHAPRRPAVASALQDHQIVQRLQAGERVSAYPAFDCTFLQKSTSSLTKYTANLGGRP